MPTIRIDEDVWRALKAKAEPFVDSPNDVLRRLLLKAPDPTNCRPAMISGVESAARQGNMEQQIQGKERRQTRARVDRTPEAAFRVPILQVLVELGGRGSVPEILKKVRRHLEGNLKPDDFKELKSGEIRWENTAKWERKQLIDDGLLEPKSGHGVWVISEQGRKYLNGRPSSQ